MAIRSDGLAFIWGSNAAGQLGNGTLPPAGQAFVSTPTVVPGLSGVTDIALNVGGLGTTAFAVLADGSVRGWGWNREGQACVGSANPAITSPQAVPGINVN